MKINCPTSSFYISLSLGVEEIDFKTNFKKCLLIEVAQYFVFLLKLSSLSPDLGPSEEAMIALITAVVYLDFNNKIDLDDFVKNDLPLIQKNFSGQLKCLSRIDKASMKNLVTACISQLVIIKNQGDPHCVL